MNYVITKKGIFRDHFIYVDTKEYDVDKLLVQNNIRGVKFGEEFRSKDYPGYALVIARVPKRNTKKFIQALSTFDKLMKLSGKCEYLECCNAALGILNQRQNVKTI